MVSHKVDIHATSLGSFISIKTTDLPKQVLPTDIAIVIDKSGSMGANADIKGEVENVGLTVLDLVKHATKTLVHGAKNPQNTMSIITYDGNIENVCTKVPLTEEGVTDVSTKIDSIVTGGATNMWGGLDAGLKAVHSINSQRRKVVLVLTDGQANRGTPASGFARGLERLREREGYDASVYAYGFGYNLNIQDLLSISNNKFGFIPDASLVGNMFVNSISNILATMEEDYPIDITLQGTTFVNGSNQCHVTSVPLQFGNTKYVLIPEVVATNEGYKITIDCRDGEMTKNAEYEDTSENLSQMVRFKYLDLIQSLCKQTDARLCIPLITQFKDKYKQYLSIEGSYANQILQELDGQITEGTGNTNFYSTWFNKYIFSLTSAHRLQQCNNFKDITVKDFAGENNLFIKLRDIADDIFTSLPPPVPTGYVRNQPSTQPERRQPVNMKKYQNQGGGCFTGDCIAILENGNAREVWQLKVGDRVRVNSHSDQTAKILAITCTQGIHEIVVMPQGLKITPWHPIRIEGDHWIYPDDIQSALRDSSMAVFNVVLDTFNTIELNSYECVTLGHDFTDPVVKHEYFGSYKVLRDLAKFEEFHLGELIVLNNESYKRGSDGLINSIVNI